jgi:hypothetical protein
MRHPIKKSLLAAGMIATVAAAWPVLGQDRPESILPPGFGDPTPEPPSAPRQPTKLPDRDPSGPDRSGGDDDQSRPRPATSSSGGSDQPTPRKRPSVAATSDRVESSGSGGKVDPNKPPSEDGEEGDETPAPIFLDIPPQAKRSTAIVGALDASDGDMGLNAFNGFNGRYLTQIMRHTKAPIVSRWASIVLRRALLSRSMTPGDVNGADWAAERAWLLLRMGEADGARMLVQGVDVDQYTPKMFDVAINSALANADPAGLCYMNEWVDKPNKETEWTISRGMCHALAGESALASAQLDRARDRKTPDIDVLLAEKVVGATRNTRRAVSVQWDDVKQLTVWRYGLAASTGLEIPANLLKSVGPHVHAWHARAPLYGLDKRLPSVDQATALGVFSHSAIVDFYGQLYDSLDPSARTASPAGQLRVAYVGNTAKARLDAMKSLWAENTNAPYQRYARMVLTAKAAAALKPGEETEADAGDIVSSILSAGMDRRAAPWVETAQSSSGLKAWGLLAVGSPEPLTDVTASKISSFGGTSETASREKAALLFAGLAGLGRIPQDEVDSMAERFEVPIGKQTKWTKAMRAAVAVNAQGTVAVLAAVGLQTRSWKTLPPAHLFHIVSALRRVGLEGEARMIAAEALTRI